MAAALGFVHEDQGDCCGDGGGDVAIDAEFEDLADGEQQDYPEGKQKEAVAQGSVADPMAEKKNPGQQKGAGAEDVGPEKGIGEGVQIGCDARAGLGGVVAVKVLLQLSDGDPEGDQGS